MKKIFFLLFLILLSFNSFSQTCTILSKANNITPDRLCSPVTATWIVTYTGVNNEGTDVNIYFDWNNGYTETVSAIETSNGVFEATSTNTYTSAGNICNYHPQATLMVDGVLCTSSTQEQIVTVWDDDDHNGGRMRINPVIWPICFGDSANVRFQDLTRFNCVPPQERDNPNVNTRWIQWIYGTDNTMSGRPLTINGRVRTFPYADEIVTLPGPVTGSGVYSDYIFVSGDKQISEYFEVTLRNWNYCNPYDDPNIPGGPRDRDNGDYPPVITTARVLIVPYPDATIYPIDIMCSTDNTVTLSAYTDGGIWTGVGVSGDIFNPEIAGAGNHIINYSITDLNGCTDFDTVTINVIPSPDATIVDIPTLCSTDSTVIMVAADTGGIWSGLGMFDNIFDPAIAGLGNHIISYTITDENGCTDYDETIVTVATPDATIYPVDTLCVDADPITLLAHDLGGVWSGPGVIKNTFDPEIAGIGTHIISYSIINPDCQDWDDEEITVVPLPVILLPNVGTLYVNSPSITLNVSPSGGTFIGNGISDNVFNPEKAGVGNHIITYTTLPDRYGCISSDTIHIKVIMPPIPDAYFLPDMAGCSPLVVNFINYSTDAETFLWNFGDGSYSREKNPVHTFYAPGRYIVKLTASNISGQTSYNRLITVYQSPTATFNVFPTEVINNSQVVMFYNYSYFGANYLWDFGDGTTSTDKDPWHKYEQEGIYKIKLTVISADGCIDTISYKSPIIVEYREGKLEFPNAFMWNKTGPTDGYWTEGSLNDYIFRPFYENIEEYKLQIFNRWGVLIYESNDLHKGWDGYYGNGTLANQGVYVWKASGKYADGKYFSLIGDVTFLH